MALVGCTQMAADMTGLLQRMLPRFMICTECWKTYCTNPIGCTELCCIGIGRSRMAWVGCTQMAADMPGLLQRILPRLDDTHLAVCIADSTFGLTPPPQEASVAKCDFLNQNTPSMHFDTFQHPGKIISGGCTERCCSDALGSDAVEWLWSVAVKWLRTCLGCCNCNTHSHVAIIYLHIGSSKYALILIQQFIGK